MGSPILLEKTSKNIKQPAISDQLLQCNYAQNFDDFSILDMDFNKFKLLLRESLLIKHDKPISNKTINLFPNLLRLYCGEQDILQNIPSERLNSTP